MDICYAVKAEKYYRLIGGKDVDGIKEFIHSNVEFYGPLAALKGKQAVIEATHNFMKAFNSLKIRAKFGEGNQAVVIYDVDIPGVAKNFPGVSLLTFQEDLIIKIELFYDGSPFSQKNKEEIFS